MSTARDVPGAAEVVEAYYKLLRGGRSSFDPVRLRAVLADDLAFEGPIAGARRGAEGFVQGVARFAEVVRGIDMLQRVADDSGAAVLYDAELPGGTVRFAEFFGIADGKVQTLKLHYNASEYRARGGR